MGLALELLREQAQTRNRVGAQMIDKCHVEFRGDKPMCSIHKDTMLVEFTVTEIDIRGGRSANPYKPTSYLCPASGQIFAAINGIPPSE